MPTTVISVRGRKFAELLADPGFVYVGRRLFGWAGSPWANPFKVGKPSGLVVDLSIVDPAWWTEEATVVRGDPVVSHCVDLYRQWILTQRVLLDRLPSLRGKVLGCWCGSWRPGEPDLLCHAVVLAKLADGPHGDPR